MFVLYWCENKKLAKFMLVLPQKLSNQTLAYNAFAWV